MTIVELIRDELTDDGVRGELRMDGQRLCHTLERPWLGNETDISCIPAGGYLCRRMHSPRFGETFEVTDVPGRSHILFHAGNTVADTHGCILLGRSRGIVYGRDGVTESRLAFKTFMRRLDGVDAFTLSIREVD
jgi:hypothetical protein